MGTVRPIKGISPGFTRAILFCIACIALNVAGSHLAITLNLPVYLDSLGTILVSIVGGYIPGIVVGYTSNLICSISDGISMYYSIVNVLIAILTSYLASKGWFNRLSRTILASVLIALTCGMVGISLSFFLKGGSLANEISNPLAKQLYATGALDLAYAELVAELFVNFIDKTLVVLMATLLYHMFSEDFLSKLNFIPWQQTPLSPQKLKEAMSTKPRRMSLGAKFVVLIAAILSSVAVATTIFSYITFHQSTIDLESTKAKGITNLMAQVVDPNMVAEYLAKGEAAPGYLETEAKLAEIRDSFDNVQYVYVYQIRADGCHVVLDPDTADEPGSDPGTVIAFEGSFEKYLPALLSGEEIEPVVSNDSYGWLLTVYTPLKNDLGETVCYLAADLSMNRLVSDEYFFVAGIVSLFAAFFVLVCAVVLWLARYSIVVPVNSIAQASSNFVVDESSIRKENLEPIKALGIRTGDEIENLYDAVNQMAQEVVRHVAETQEKSDAIARMQSNLILVLADLVESRDKFTGDHVRNTATYTRIIMNQMRREGICPDVLTNEFISNVYQSAPLHDIGKIAVPDAILNKPGRLTAEEFTAMKNHTLAGQEILENAKGAVSESSYLDEAQRLAAYHHEKWDGSGYPYGLAGEEIPLSARIMAVADVFDALVSKRSYKEGFPVEKAFAIIEEGIGTHFDPQVARAFLHARDKASAIVQKTKEANEAAEKQADADKPSTTSKSDKPDTSDKPHTSTKDEN
ncbi:MAG: HD domain-containing phosphohydrolase [Atopobiaceae bacterium]|nr:HD domain-containing phosphohydrolase [Atopobiaceae bacterium]